MADEPDYDVAAADDAPVDDMEELELGAAETLAAEEAGYEPAFAIESNAVCSNVFASNFPGARLLHADVKDVVTADLTALNTLINELYTDINAHEALTAGGVHGASDGEG